MCVPFLHAKAVSINFAAVNPAGAGNLRAWPWDSIPSPQPSTAVLTYFAGANISNGVVIPVCQWEGTSGGCIDALFIQANVAAVHVVADVFGYFSIPQRTALDCTNVDVAYPVPCDGSAESHDHGDRVVRGGLHAHGRRGAFRHRHQLDDHQQAESRPGDQQRRLHGHQQLVNAHTGLCQARCCRTPGRQ